MTETRSDEAPWPLRAILLLALGALAGLAIHWLTKGGSPWEMTESSVRLAAAAGIGIGSIGFAFSLERARWPWSIGFGLVVGLVTGFVTWSNGPFGSWGANEGWQIFSALLAVAIAVPLFQTARDSGRLRFDYQALHGHAWTNIVLWCAAWGFVLVTWLLAQLLSELFNLIGIHLLRDLMREAWFNLMLIGGAFGLAAGLFRDRDRVLVLLQTVVTAILSVLTPVLAVGLVLFVLSLPFTGLEPLWSQTKQTTPILLVCILGAFLLVNATIGPEEEPRAAWLRHSAMGLAAVMLPLGIVAAISLGKRIGQYGLTPERLWAAVFVLVALAAGLLYLAAIARRRLGWATDVRRANIGLALGVCGLALFLALPILSFGRVSANSQVARLESGKVAPEKFDWVALRFDFGPAGERAVARLARGARDARARSLAARILPRKHRYEAMTFEYAARQAARPHLVTVLPSPAEVPAQLTDLLFRSSENIANQGFCAADGKCLLEWQPGSSVAIAILDPCGAEPRQSPRPAPRLVDCEVTAKLFQQGEKGWHEVGDYPTGHPYNLDEIRAQRAGVAAGAIELREIRVRQIFIGGKPVGGPLSPVDETTPAASRK